MKNEPHDQCPRKGHISFYDSERRRAADVLTLYIRDPITRQNKAVGLICRRCGAVKRDGWKDWVTAGPVSHFP